MTDQRQDELVGTWDRGKDAVMHFWYTMQNTGAYIGMMSGGADRGKPAFFEVDQPYSAKELDIIERGSRDVLKAYGLMLARTGLPTLTNPNEWVSGDDWEPLPEHRSLAWDYDRSSDPEYDS
jgi:hypothetical protein